MAKGKIDVSTGEVLSGVPEFQAPFLRSAYSDHASFSDSFGLACKDESRTQQSFAEECDINTIVKRFGLTGQLPSNIRAPQYADFSDAKDFRESMDAILAAKSSFMSLPAEVRASFGNDPAAFVDFCSDPNNRDEMGKLGLLSPDAWSKRQAELKALADAAFLAEAEKQGFVKPPAKDTAK